ncbi:MAG: MATE family efflux transporter [Massilibacteroides sp.]|nr:MATE family efflux transporter [Massilibacteroides sp.]
MEKNQFWSLYRPHYVTLVRLGIPIVMGQLAMVLLSFFDTLMVGHYGTPDLASASFVGSLIFLPIMFLMGITMGLVPLSGSAYGRGDLPLVGAYLRNSVLVAAVCLTFCMLVLVGVYFALPAMGQDPTLLPLIQPLFLIHLASLPFVMVFYVGKQFTDSITQTKVSMYVIVGGVLLNILLNALLINGLGPFPEWGVLGAGTATLITRILMALVYLVLMRFNQPLRPYYLAAKQAVWSRQKFMELQKMGWPIAMQLFLEGSSFALTTVMAGWISTPTLAAHQVMLTISQLFFMIYLGVGSAMTVRISNFVGQHDYVQVRHIVWAGFHMIMALAIFNCTVAFLGRYTMAHLFTEDVQVLALIPTAMLALMLYQLGDAIQLTFVSALRGIGEVRVVAWTSFVCYVLVSLPISYTLGVKAGFGLPGIWSAFPISLSLAGLIYYLSYRRFMKRVL